MSPSSSPASEPRPSPDSTRAGEALPAWKRQLPNALTMARMGLAVVFFVVMAMFDYRRSPVLVGGVDWWLILSAGLFIVAAATDALDGHLARKWGVVSLFGRVMDPFADKLLVLGAFVMLAGPGFAGEEQWTSHVFVPGKEPFDQEVKMWVTISHVTTWMAVAILAREILITSLRGVYEAKGVSFAATAIGKWKMILQSVCVPLVLLLPNVPQEWGRPRTTQGTITGEVDWVEWTIIGVVWATVIVSVWSGVPYVMRAIRESGKLSEGKA